MRKLCKAEIAVLGKYGFFEKEKIEKENMTIFGTKYRIMFFSGTTIIINTLCWTMLQMSLLNSWKERKTLICRLKTAKKLNRFKKMLVFLRH